MGMGVDFGVYTQCEQIDSIEAAGTKLLQHSLTEGDVAQGVPDVGTKLSHCGDERQDANFDYEGADERESHGAEENCRGNPARSLEHLFELILGAGQEASAHDAHEVAHGEDNGEGFEVSLEEGDEGAEGHEPA